MVSGETIARSNMNRFFLFLLVIFRSAAFGEGYASQFEGSFPDWELKRLELISLFLPSNPVILDAGAHYGNETIAMARRWVDGKIYAMEPNPHAFEILSNAVSEIDSILCYPFALSDRSGKAPFYVCHGSSGDNPIYEHASSLLKPSPSMEIHYKGPMVQAECKNLDEWLREMNLDRIDFLNLDLQGSELQVLKASPKTLSMVAAIQIHTYFYPFRVGMAAYPDVRAFLESHGFKLLSHWYREGLEGIAIFIKNTFFDGFPSYGDLESNQFFTNPFYRICFSPYLDASFYIDEVPDSIKSFLRKGDTWEGNIAVLIEQFAKKGSIAIDVGAHIGIHTLKMSQCVGSKGAVVAFEPQVKMFAEQLRNLKLNRCKNVISIRKACGEKFQFIQMNPIDPTNEGGTMIGSGGDIAELIPLDSLHLENVSLIKIDAEEAEYFVLQGAKETILRNKPVILFEILNRPDYENSPLHEKVNYIRVISLLESFGYEPYVVFGNDYIAFPADDARFDECREWFFPAENQSLKDL